MMLKSNNNTDNDHRKSDNNRDDDDDDDGGGIWGRKCKAQQALPLLLQLQPFRLDLLQQLLLLITIQSNLDASM